MMRQTVFGFKIEKTEGTLTAHGGLALLASERSSSWPSPSSNRCPHPVAREEHRQRVHRGFAQDHMVGYVLAGGVKSE